MNCKSCTASLPQDTAFCGVCGARASKRRHSLTGMLFDGRYRVEAKLAAGGFGAIYRATHVLTGARVALKVLHPEFTSDTALSARFRREASVLASLRDPHTIKTYEHGAAADGTLYIAMELLSGRSLQAELRTQGPLPWWRMLSIMRGVCCSLIEAHALGVVHRDLKPANIHLEHRGNKADFAKVLDFGIVKVLNGEIDDESDITRVGQAIGTLEYMSPEQIVGGEIDHRTDIYTLGLVAYEMITGRRPFAEATGATGLMTALMTRAPVPPSTLFHRDCFPEAVDRLILRCLECDPRDRFASAKELVEAIDELLVYATPTPIALNSTLPGSVPTTRRKPAAPRNSVPSLAGSEDGDLNPLDVTTVDASPLFPVQQWEPALDKSSERLARTPHLDTPPDPPAFKAARGSTVSVAPMPASSVPQPSRLGPLKLAGWAVALLASGIGLGMLVATLI